MHATSDYKALLPPLNKNGTVKIKILAVGKIYFNMEKTTFKFGQKWRFTFTNLSFGLIYVSRY